ncbi:MAG TPA: hypothetical protein VKS60_08735 [Stellaceae bacterium]|nr:hypothetical protein [Stellaceae bacterium]
MKCYSIRAASLYFMFTVSGAALSACAVVSGADGPGLPEQPAITEANPATVTILLPTEIYRSLPPSGPSAHTATEAQLESVETYALTLPPGSRTALTTRVNLCRFSARSACIVMPVTDAGS